MKVLYLTNYPAPYRRRFFNALGELCDLTVIYEYGNSDSSRNKKWIDDKKYDYKEMAIHNDLSESHFDSCNSLNSFLKGRFDIIIIGGYSSLIEIRTIYFLKKNNIPFFISSDGGFIKKDNKFKSFIKSRLMSSASYWMSSGKETTKYLVHYGAKENKTFSYHFTSLDKQDILLKQINSFEKGILKKKIGVVEKTMVVFVGQFIPRKGLDLLVAAGNELPNIGFYLIGSDNFDKKYSNQCRQNFGNNFHEIPFLTKDELNVYYEAADVFVLPTREDIWGLVINEAMAKGLPIITTTKCLAGLELVDDSNGKLVSPDNVEELRQALIDLLSSDLEEKGKASLEKIKNYTFDQMAHDYYDAFNKITIHENSSN